MTSTTCTKFASFAQAVESVLPADYPAFWVGVVKAMPNKGRGYLLLREVEIIGNPEDGFQIGFDMEAWFDVVQETTSPAAAEAAVNPNAGDRETGWYRESVLETGVSMAGRRIRVVYPPGYWDPEEYYDE